MSVIYEVIIVNKKEELLVNAAKIIYEQGIQKLTIDYLAKRSNITKAGVLYHFENKANLLLEMNEMAIQRFENILERYLSKLTGTAIFTRAYAYATLEFFRKPETALLPAVFISSLEDENSFKLWKKTSAHWEQKFKKDSGNPNENLKLQLICDGIWFSILYGSNESLNKQIESLVLSYCDSLAKGNN